VADNNWTTAPEPFANRRDKDAQRHREALADLARAVQTHQLIERSSLGTSEAKALGASVSDEQVAAVMARVKEIESSNQSPIEKTLDELYRKKWYEFATLVLNDKATKKSIAIAWGKLNGVLDAKEALVGVMTGQ
jgi:hypothetical protein